MTETNPNPDPQLDEPVEEPETTPPPAPDKAERKGYAVYDTAELRFRGRVHDKRKDADDLKSELGKGKRRGRFEVREV